MGAMGAAASARASSGFAGRPGASRRSPTPQWRCRC